MAAVRCAARRLGGSLLQRMPAVVAEEGRLLVPSRCMRPRHLSGKVSGEVKGRFSWFVLWGVHVYGRRSSSSFETGRLRRLLLRRRASSAEEEVQMKSKSKKSKCHVRPPGNRSEATPEEATARTIRLSDLSELIMVFHKNVLPVPP
ncbi:hypothetical protein ZWY2020_045688 [Hordeum vulgare]|nr:hypothetical protein ZWY2020_045688 [Hordeum vulgare]